MIQILFTAQAEKQIAKLDRNVRLRIIASLERLREAYPVGDMRKMQGYDDLWRCVSVITGLSCRLIWSLPASRSL